MESRRKQVGPDQFLHASFRRGAGHLSFLQSRQSDEIREGLPFPLAMPLFIHFETSGGPKVEGPKASGGIECGDRDLSGLERQSTVGDAQCCCRGPRLSRRHVRHFSSRANTAGDCARIEKTKEASCGNWLASASLDVAVIGRGGWPAHFFFPRSRGDARGRACVDRCGPPKASGPSSSDNLGCDITRVPAFQGRRPACCNPARTMGSFVAARRGDNRSPGAKVTPLIVKGGNLHRAGCLSACPDFRRRAWRSCRKRPASAKGRSARRVCGFRKTVLSDQQREGPGLRLLQRQLDPRPSLGFNRLPIHLQFLTPPGPFQHDAVDTTGPRLVRSQMDGILAPE